MLYYGNTTESNNMRTYKYFLGVTFGSEKIEREVSVEDFCKAERQAGFYPKLWSGDTAFMTTPATGGFSSSGVSGRVEYIKSSDISDEQ
jgi:hypothetical protein